MAHGCTIGAAVDRTGEPTIDLEWTIPHSNCLIVSPGTTVHWNGDFTTHPLNGGISPNEDFTSPISIATPTNLVTSVTFETSGDYPYFCEVHLLNMAGVIYVADAPPEPLIFKDSFEN